MIELPSFLSQEMVFLQNGEGLNRCKRQVCANSPARGTAMTPTGQMALNIGLPVTTLFSTWRFAKDNLASAVPFIHSLCTHLESLRALQRTRLTYISHNLRGKSKGAIAS